MLRSVVHKLSFILAYIVFAILASYATMSSILFFCTNFIIFKDFTLASTLTLAISALPAVVISLITYIRFKRKQKPIQRYVECLTAIILLTLVISLNHLITAINLDNQYNQMLSYYAELTSQINGSKLQKAWLIAKDYNKSFKSIYGTLLVPPPRMIRLLQKCVPSWSTISTNSYAKIVALSRTGCCEELAIALTTLIRDTLNLPTRTIRIEGIDHLLPEVLCDGSWYVIDIGYTTPKGPVKASDYANHLKSKPNCLDRFIARLLTHPHGLDVTREHGFNTSTLVIKAIVDPTTSPLDDKPAANAHIEIFALTNRHDPLVAQGTTNNNGLYAVILNGDKDYVVIATTYINSVKYTGVACIHLPPNKCLTIEVRLH